MKELILSYMKLRDPFPHAMFGFLLMPSKIRYAIWKRKVTPWVEHTFLEYVCGDDKDPRWNRMDVKENLKLTLLSTSIPHNLMWEDKSSMRWSVESRVPFMDVNVVETAMSIETEQLLGKRRNQAAVQRCSGRWLNGYFRIMYPEKSMLARSSGNGLIWMKTFIEVDIETC